MTRRHYVTSDDVAGVSRPEYPGQYSFDRPLSPRKKFLVGGLLIALPWILGFLIVAFPYRHIGADLVRLWHVFSGGW